jgi:aminoglycoside phosphotransferase (APT) family kinase protein
MSLPEGIDVARLASWMDGLGLGEGPLRDISALGGGTQNILIRFQRGEGEYVLRRPPLHKRAKSDDTMLREARVLEAIRNTCVPHPRLIRCCQDPEVLGATFYLMEPVNGVNPTIELPEPYLRQPTWLHVLGLAMIDAIARLGALDYESLGLRDFGRSTGYLERQVDRWRSQLESYAAIPSTRRAHLPGIADLARWLDSRRPQRWQPGLIHGDFHLGNVLIKDDSPDLLAIVDWELSTIGDPLIDLGWLLATWPEPSQKITTFMGQGPWSGLPTPEELVDRYSDASDLDISHSAWYEVLACYKLAIILEGTYVRAHAGQANIDVGERLHADARRLVERALDRISTQ